MDKNRTEADTSNFEIGFYEGILEKQGDFIEALTVLGDLYTKKGMFKKGLDVDKRLSRLRPDDSIVLYNLACSYSLVGEIDNSFETIKQAVAVGYTDYQYLEQDADLRNLLADSRFQKYLGECKRNSAAEAPKKTDNA